MTSLSLFYDVTNPDTGGMLDNRHENQSVSVEHTKLFETLMTEDNFKKYVGAKSYYVFVSKLKAKLENKNNAFDAVRMQKILKETFDIERAAVRFSCLFFIFFCLVLCSIPRFIFPSSSRKHSFPSVFLLSF